MILHENKWLSHLNPEMMKGAQRHLCAYLVALEGWRRGLKLTWTSKKVKKRGIHAPGRVFTLSSEHRTHEFYKTRGDKVSQRAVTITGNKDRAKEYFTEYGVPTPKGKRFTKEISDKEILNFADQLKYPLVLKPTKGFQGIGVIVNIKDKAALEKSLIYVREELGYSDVIIERFIEGEEYRVFVIEDEVISVLWRIPANIIGDGVHTIQELISQKNKVRKRNPRLATCLINIDREVKSNIKKVGMTLESVLPKDQQLYLRENSNISTGGDSIEMLDEFPTEYKQVAINSLKAISDLPHGGVDVLVDSNKPIEEAAHVIEINAIPQIGSLVFPMVGQARDIPAAIIDYYFPETKNQKKLKSNVYFDFRETLRPLRSKVAKEITVTPAPTEFQYTKKYLVFGKVQGVGYRQWIRRRALEHDLFGSVKNLNNGSVEVIVSGNQSIVNEFKNICLRGSKSSNVEQVEAIELDIPIKVGFEIKPTKRKNKRKKPEKSTPKKLTFKQKVIKKLRRIIMNK